MCVGGGLWENLRNVKVLTGSVNQAHSGSTTVTFFFSLIQSEKGFFCLHRQCVIFFCRSASFLKVGGDLVSVFFFPPFSSCNQRVKLSYYNRQPSGKACSSLSSGTAQAQLRQEAAENHNNIGVLRAF